MLYERPVSATPIQPTVKEGLSSLRCNFFLCCYLRPALRRPSNVMSKAFRAAFHRLVHRLRPLSERWDKGRYLDVSVIPTRA